MKSLIEAYQQMGRPLIFGHRGASAYAPMNTLPAFDLAARQGADGIELDVWLSADGHLMVIHDAEVDHTTDGSGHVGAMTLAQLKELDAGGGFNEAFAGTRIPTLDETFEEFGQKLFINVEIKSVMIYTDGIEQAVADIIARFNLQRRVLVSSFNPIALRRFKELLPEVAIGYLHDPHTPYYFDYVLYDMHYEAHHPHFSQVNAEYMFDLRKSSQWVNVWTVNDPASALELCDLGVSGIITDKPDAILNALPE